MDKFNNKYRIPSARLQWWDYGTNGAYFITICTRNRVNFFGEIVDTPVQTQPTMQLNELGQLAETYWLEIPNKFSFIELGNFVVMPNHTHGILIINKPNANVTDANVTDANVTDANVTDANVTDANVTDANVSDANVSDANVSDANVQTRLIASLQPPIQPPTEKTGGFAGNKNPMLNDNISRIIRWYKGRCSFEIKKTHSDFAWQSRFHDHIIRDAQSFETIQNYIANNPLNWVKDKFYG